MNEELLRIKITFPDGSAFRLTDLEPAAPGNFLPGLYDAENRPGLVSLMEYIRTHGNPFAGTFTARILNCRLKDMREEDWEKLFAAKDNIAEFLRYDSLVSGIDLKRNLDRIAEFDAKKYQPYADRLERAYAQWPAHDIYYSLPDPEEWSVQNIRTFMDALCSPTDLCRKFDNEKERGRCLRDISFANPQLVDIICDCDRVLTDEDLALLRMEKPAVRTTLQMLTYLLDCQSGLFYEDYYTEYNYPLSEDVPSDLLQLELKHMQELIDAIHSEELRTRQTAEISPEERKENKKILQWYRTKYYM